jgi:hypothetical protein
MKILKRIFLVLVVLLLVLLSLGIFFPHFNYGNEITIRRSPQLCWDVYTDTTAMHGWIPGFESLRLKKGQPWQAGSEYEFVITEGERMVMQRTIDQVTPASSISFNLNNDVLISEYTVTFTGDSTHTILATDYQVTGKNIFMKSVLYLSKPYLKNADEQMLLSLKKIIESKP